MGENKKLLGTISALATFAIMVTVAWVTGALSTAFSEFASFMTGGFREIAASETTFMMMLAIIVAVVVMELPSCMAGTYIQAAVHGQHNSHAVREMFEKMTDGNHFMNLFLLVFVEELFARWLFIGLLPKIPFLSGDVAFYVLLVVGNALWALLHVLNFKEQKDRKVLRTLPQFIAGFFFAFIFVKYGLFAAVLTHFASNAVIMSMFKKQRVNGVDAMAFGYSAITAGVSYLLMTKPLTDIQPWFADGSSFQLEGWGFWDYVKLSVFVTAGLFALFSLLLYDRGEVADQDIKWWYHIVGIPVMAGILFGGYKLLGFVTDDTPTRVLILAAMVAFVSTMDSASAIARTFWYVLPDTFITICVLQALGFWPAIGWLAVETAIHSPRLVLNKFDD